MKNGTLLAAAITLLAGTLAPLAAHAHESDVTLENLVIQANAASGENSATIYCAKAYEGLLAKKTSGSTKITLNSSDGQWVGSFTIDEVGKRCQQMRAPIGVKNIDFIGYQVFEVLEQIGRGDNLLDLASMTEKCHDAVRWALVGGLDPSTPVFVTDHFKGTLGEADAKVCALGDAKINAVNAVSTARYKGILKGDKLAWMLKSYPHGYFIGRDNVTDSTDAKKLAAAKAWFEILERDLYDGESCAAGKIFVYRKNTFDKNHKHVKTSEKEYCGDPGPRAMK